jgi:hypothetical protein
MAFKTIWLIGANVGFVYCAWLCLFKTDKLVERGRKNHLKSSLSQSSPTSGMVTSKWYPTYIRCAGIFIVLWLVLVDFVLIKAK